MCLCVCVCWAVVFGESCGVASVVSNVELSKLACACVKVVVESCDLDGLKVDSNVDVDSLVGALVTILELVVGSPVVSNGVVVAETVEVMTGPVVRAAGRTQIWTREPSGSAPAGTSSGPNGLYHSFQSYRLFSL